MSIELGSEREVGVFCVLLVPLTMFSKDIEDLDKAVKVAKCICDMRREIETFFLIL